jgi:hypothetical protein
MIQFSGNIAERRLGRPGARLSQVFGPAVHGFSIRRSAQFKIPLTAHRRLIS